MPPKYKGMHTDQSENPWTAGEPIKVPKFIPMPKTI